MSPNTAAATKSGLRLKVATAIPATVHAIVQSCKILIVFCRENFSVVGESVTASFGYCFKSNYANKTSLVN
jgi:hypothetical protein